MLLRLRECLWPMLEPKRKRKQDRKSFRIDDNPSFEYTKENMQYKILEYALDYYKQEDDRRKEVETKASLFIGVISVAFSLFLGIFSIAEKKNFNSFTGFELIITLVCFTTLLTYMLRSAWFAVKALERQKYHVVSVEDFFIQSSEEHYYKQLIEKIVSVTNSNSEKINEKVDYMVLAQEYFKRMIWAFVFCVGSFFLFFFL